MNPWNRTLLKIFEDIEERALKVGVTRDKLIIVYCGTGCEATNEYAIFKHLLGYPNVRLYEGSITEWSAHPDLEVVAGSNPK